jgi:hypothetical protein
MKILRVKGGSKVTAFTNRITGQLGKDTGRFGLFHYGSYEYGAINEIGFDEHGVYQMRWCQEGYIPVKCRWPLTVPEVATPARQIVWAKYRQAIIEWQALTSEQKAVYNERVKGTRLNGCNLYVKEYMLSH